MQYLFGRSIADMRRHKAAAFVVAAMISVGLSDPVEADLIECAAAAVSSPAPEAFASFCGKCHKAKELSAKYFVGLAADEATRREGELAKFLDRHSACPHQHHEEIAAWLRELASRK